MLYRSNLLALIPGGRRVEYAENVVLAYDLQKNDLCMDSAFKNKVRLSFWELYSRRDHRECSSVYDPDRLGMGKRN